MNWEAPSACGGAVHFLASSVWQDITLTGSRPCQAKEPPLPRRRLTNRERTLRTDVHPAS